MGGGSKSWMVLGSEFCHFFIPVHVIDIIKIMADVIVIKVIIGDVSVVLITQIGKFIN